MGRRCGEIGDQVVIISYVFVTDDDAKNLKKQVVRVDGQNRIESC